MTAATWQDRIRCRQRIRTLCVILVVLGMVPFLKGAETAPSPGFAIRNWERQDGLSHAPIQAVARTEDGYLWIATSNGLARFDGQRFFAFTTNNTPELKDQQIVCLSASKSGDLWIGTETGVLTCLRAGEFKTVSLGGRESGHRINSLVEDSDGGLWIGTQGAGIAHWRQGTCEWFNLNSTTNSDDWNVTQ